METPSENTLDREDDLRASNEVMKLKLELEHNMVMSESAGLPPEVENQWLNYVYNFEKLSKEAKRVKVYDLLGRPSYVKFELLDEDQVSDELSRLSLIMQSKGIILESCCDYEDTVVYRFITEELFEHETDDLAMPGMTHHFLYEEFHPNHDYDLRRETKYFVEKVLSKKWDEQYDVYKLTDEVTFLGMQHPRQKISAFVLSLQEAHTVLELKHLEIRSVHTDLETCEATVEADVMYDAQPAGGQRQLVKGKASIHFKYEHEYWSVCGFELPGFGA